jgi:hypothetical protein
MSQTRAQLDHKLTLLEERARELSPKRYAREHMPEYLAERVIGGFLLLFGTVMLVKQIRGRRDRRAEVHHALVAYGRW